MIFDFNKGFDDNQNYKYNKRPVIAISAHIIEESSALHFAYSKAIMDAGATPIIVPANCDASSLIGLMRSIDGLLLSGGADIDATYFGEENLENLTDVSQQRDYSEFMLLRAAIDCGVPIFGICRGCQLLNIALGGTIYQDLPSQFDTKPLPHSILVHKEKPVHQMAVTEGSWLHKIVETNSVAVNSRHHQAIKDVAPLLKVVGTSPDGVIEAVEGYPTNKIIAVQCHPENLATDGGSKEMQKLFKFFAAEAELYRRAKELHLHNISVDSHCDTPMVYGRGGFNFASRNSNTQVDLVKMSEGYLDSTITVAYISQKTDPKEATKMAFSTLEKFKGDLAKISDKISVTNSISEIKKAKIEGKKSLMVAIENGLTIGDDLSNIEKFKNEEVVYITLCHNGTNQICDSAIGEVEHNGVSPFGKEVISEMNRVGITVDISHSSEKSTLDALEMSSKPIIASHSSCKALCNHPRNLSDQTIKAIAAKGGVIQICGYSSFLAQDGNATILTLVEHIEHAIKLVGYDYVGIGSDFDGGGGGEGFNGANNFINITVELLRRGHSEENIAKILGGNILRVLQQNNSIYNPLL